MSDINQMEVKQLRNEVQLLRDELAIFKRKYEDIIYNLDDDNFSSTLLREKEGMKTSIEVNAEGIKTKVSNEEFESAKTQLAGQITSEVNKLGGTLTTQINQTADVISQEVTNRTNADMQLSSQIIQTANGISSRVESVEKGKFGKYTLFTQTADKFVFTGNVDTDNLSCTRLYAKGNYNGYNARLNGNLGDFGIFNGDAGDGASAKDATCMFGIYNEMPNVNFFVYSHNFFGYDSLNQKFWVKGTWDFSACDEVIGLGGVGGGTAKFA